MTTPVLEKQNTGPPLSHTELRKRILFALLFFVLGAASAALLLAPRLRSAEPEPLEHFSVHLLTPDKEQTLELKRGAVYTLQAPPDIENYRFLGWRTEDGRLLLGQTLSVDRELYFAAEYAVKLEADWDLPLLLCDEQGNYRPFEPLTRGECAEMLASLLAAPVASGKAFSDLRDGSACAEAAQKLRTLGLFTGNSFHPKKSLSRAEFLTMLASFYPAAQARFAFSDLDRFDPRYGAFCTAAACGWIESGDDVPARPDEVLTRAEAAVIMNRLLARRFRPGDYFVSDLAESDAFYREIVMAAGSLAAKRPAYNITLDGIALGDLEPGLHLEGLVLFCVTEDHELLRDGSFEGFSFDNKGHYTTGDKELDALLFPALQEACDGLKTRKDMLKAIYNYVMDRSRYLKRHYYTPGDTSWIYDEAKTMLSRWTGNCYNYSSTFYFLTRAIGYDTVIYSGYVAGSLHGWCEIEFDGEPYIFDVELQDAYRDRLGQYINMYKLSYEDAHHWYYDRGKSDPEPEPQRGPHTGSFDDMDYLLVDDAP